MTYKKIELVRSNWEKASKNLKFTIITPYVVCFEDKCIKNVFGFVPNYGSKNGTIIDLIFPPEYIIDKDIEKIAKEKKCHYSYINIDSILNYDENYYIELLEDWGKFGNGAD